MISWKHSFRRLSEEYAAARKKRAALDNLVSMGKISQPTHELFNREIDEAVSEIEKQRQALLEKMNLKIDGLEQQIRTLEILLAELEIQHVTGEVDEGAYQRETNLLTVGLDTARNELEAMKEATNLLANSGTFVQQELEQPSQESCEPKAEFLEETPATAENIGQEGSQDVTETAQCTQEIPLTEAPTEEKQEN